ncbi:MAG TPA: 1-phosphofructokinase family hexose kinase [Planctomycetaceae bacterium]|nr:1-phosphofructokinase family hexose kinase [Planctomycetaceae bacterium]
MILVAGLTPAWQQIAVLERLRAGEVNRAREVRWCASGKVLNVGLALTQLGADSSTLSLVGSGPAGAMMRQDMAQLGVSVRWIESAAPQRVCTTLLDRELGTTTEIVENSPIATPQELQAFADAFAEESSAANVELVVLTGSLPASAPSEFYSSLLRRTRAKAILDIRGPELLAALPHRPFVVKPNREELAHTVNRSLTAETDVWRAMSELTDLGAEWVVVTSGPDDVLVSHYGDRWRFTPPRVEVVNPIGCGDCFAAGLAGSLQQGRDPLEAIQLGMAAAAQNATQLLPARL